MRAIHRHTFPIDNRFKLDLPQGAKILHVGMQDREPSIWAIGESNAFMVKRSFRLFDTNDVIRSQEKLQHVGSFQQGQFFWHLFEVIKPKRKPTSEELAANCVVLGVDQAEVAAWSDKKRMAFIQDYLRRKK